MSASLLTVLAADAHLDEGQLLREQPTVSKGKLPKVSRMNVNTNSFMQERTIFIFI
jgi:hypothetical protein